MTVTPENVLYHEITGLELEVMDSTDSSLIGVSGRIAFESRNMICIQKNDGHKIQAAKRILGKISLKTESGACFISGSSLIGKPEDRLERLH